MDFRPNKLKLIISILVALILTIVLAIAGAKCTGGPCPSEVYQASFFLSFVIFGLPSFLIIYLVWSFIQKK